MANFPVTPFRNLPEATNLSSGSLNLLGIQNNTQTVRIKFADLTDGFVTMAGQEPDTPYATVTGDLYITEDGLLSNEPTSGWGKSPRYTTHWDDLTSDVRFLYVNDVMGLNPTELANARETLNIHVAEADDLGLVKAIPIQQTDIQGASAIRIVAGNPVEIENEDGSTYSSSPFSAGTIVVPYATPTEPGVVTIGETPPSEEEWVHIRDHAAVSRAYLEYCFDHLKMQQTFPVATYSTMGGIIPDENQFVLGGDTGEIMSLLTATEPDHRFYSAGEYSAVPARGVKLAYSTPYSSTDDQGTLSEVDIDQVTTVRRVRAEVDYKIEAVRKWRAGYSGAGTETGFGLVALVADGAIVAPYSSDDPGRLDVRPATGTAYGAVTVADSIDKDISASPDAYQAVVTPSAVVEYVQEEIKDAFSASVIANWALSTFPPPSYSTRGVAAIDGETIMVNYPTNGDAPQLYVPSATTDSAGVIKVTGATFADLYSSTTVAASPAAVTEYVDRKMSSLGWEGGSVIYSATFYQGVYDGTVYPEDYSYSMTQLVTYGKVLGMLGGGEEGWSGGPVYTDIVTTDGVKIKYGQYSDYSYYGDYDVMPKIGVEDAITNAIQGGGWFSGYIYGSTFSRENGVITYPGSAPESYAAYGDMALVPKTAIENRLATVTNGYLKADGAVRIQLGSRLSYAANSPLNLTVASYSDYAVPPAGAVRSEFSKYVSRTSGGVLGQGATISYDGWYSDPFVYSERTLLPRAAIQRMIPVGYSSVYVNEEYDYSGGRWVSYARSLTSYSFRTDEYGIPLWAADVYVGHYSFVASDNTFDPPPAARAARVSAGVNIVTVDYSSGAIDERHYHGYEEFYVTPYGNTKQTFKIQNAMAHMPYNSKVTVLVKGPMDITVGSTSGQAENLNEANNGRLVVHVVTSGTPSSNVSGTYSVVAENVARLEVVRLGASFDCTALVYRDTWYT